MPLVAAGALFLSCGGAAAQPRFVTIHIPSKPMAQALVDFALQGRLSISDSGLSFGSTASNPVDGTFEETDALRRLLAGSRYGFRAAGPASIRIVELAAPASSRGQYQTAIENVVVTATKRSEVAQTAPYSIAVVSGQQIESTGVKAPIDLTTQVAGLTATNLGPGEDKLFVRGLADSVLPGISESVVGLYLDDARIADDAPDPNLQLVDVDRVEVLRGPQGSLYGAGSLVGLVHIVTKQPVLDQFQAMAGASFSNTDEGGLSEGGQAMLNIPIIEDRLALRAVGYFDSVGGYVDDVRLRISNANGTTIAGTRETIALQLSANWTAKANFAWQTTNSDDSQYYDQALGPFKRDTYLREPHTDKFLLAGLELNGTLGRADLLSNTSFLDRHYTTVFDASLAWPQLTGYALGPSPFQYVRSILSVGHETRLVSDPGGRWQWLLGVFLSHRDEDSNSALSGPGNSGQRVNAWTEQREDRVNEAAVFGEATYDLTRALSMTAGARLFLSAHNVTAFDTGPVSPTSGRTVGANDQQGVAPKFVMSYRPNYDMTLYLQYSEGFRPGGINVDGPAGATGEAGEAFDGDVLRNYEGGAKLRLLDGRAIVNSAVYYVSWRNVQTDQIAPQGAFLILNAGDVRDFGGEIDISLVPLTNLTLVGNGFWNNSRLSHTNPALTTTEGVLPGAPKFSLGGSARYDIPIRQSLAFVAADYSYVGVSHIGFSEGAPAMGNYHLANLRLGLDRGPWEITLFVNNVTNDHGNTFAFGNPFSFGLERQITPPRARTYGLSIAWNR